MYLEHAFVELHWKGKRISLIKSRITCVSALEKETLVYVLGLKNPYQVDETYDCVLEKIVTKE